MRLDHGDGQAVLQRERERRLALGQPQHPARRADHAGPLGLGLDALGAASGASAAKGIGYTVNGDKLSVYFYAGICDSYGLHADESTPGRVQVTVVVTVTPKPGRSCPMLVREQQADATLTSPLDGRAVVDTGTDKQLPQLSMPGGTKFYSPGPVKIGG
ncbi:hypothetical protein GXW82_23100 [Streptacidiphilus sp. 4-A2]|nr:hypothetical protein [Streptacidiphilus sp. 4-A2]